jgi:hypothetical protein
MLHSIVHTAPLAGLTTEEAIEFAMLDALPPFDDSGQIGWIFEGEPTSQREKRWLELYTKLTARSPCGGGEPLARSSASLLRRGRGLRFPDRRRRRS